MVQARPHYLLRCIALENVCVVSFLARSKPWTLSIRWKFHLLELTPGRPCHEPDFSEDERGRGKVWPSSSVDADTNVNLAAVYISCMRLTSFSRSSGESWKIQSASTHRYRWWSWLQRRMASLIVVGMSSWEPDSPPGVERRNRELVSSLSCGISLPPDQQPC